MRFEKVSDKDGNIILADAEGNTAEFEFVEMSVFDGEEYAVLLEKGDDMVTILRFEENAPDGREYYYTVDDDDVFESVYEAFREEFGDEFDFE